MPDAIPEMPEDLSALSDAELQQLIEQVRGQAAAVVDEAMSQGTGLEGMPQEAHDLVKACAEIGAAVSAEIEGRNAAKSEDAARTQQALEILGVTPGAQEGDDNTDESPVEEPAQAASVPPETLAVQSPITTAATIPVDTAAQPVPSPETAPQEATLADEIIPPADELDLSNIADPVSALATINDTGTALQPVPFTVPAQPNRMSVRTRMRQPGSLIQFQDRGTLDLSTKDRKLDKHELAKTIAEKYEQLRRQPLNGNVIVATAVAEQVGPKMGVDAHGNSAILRQSSREMAVAASGGNCAIPTNNYDVFNAAEEQAPVDGFLRSINADRGGVRYLSAPDWADAQGGITIVPSGDDTSKVCIHFPCPTELECVVDAVAACAEFDNLNFRASTELVEVLLDQLAVAQAQSKEIMFLDAIESGSTAVTGDVTEYGAIRALVWNLGNATHAYRKRNHISPNMPIDVLAPDTLVPILYADAVADHALGMNALNLNKDTLAAELFSSLNLNVEFYYDYSTDYGSINAMQNAQGPGSIGNFPTDFRFYFWAPGTWSKLDAGILNLGIVRDSTLNAVNNLQIFSEEWVQPCKFGAESMALDVTLCPSGVGPEAGTALACAS